MIPPQVVTDLCTLGQLGESESAEAQSILGRLAPWDEVNRQHGENWNRVTDGLSTECVVNLVRGLVLTEEALRWTGGSVSGVIWTYRALENRDQNSARTVAHWGEDRSTNPWVPFRRRSVGELQAERAMRATRQANSARNQEQRERAKAGRERGQATRKEHAVTTSKVAQERASFLQSLAGHPLPDRLRTLLEAQDSVVLSLPEAWATEAICDAVTLDPQLRDQLIERLASWRNGPWRRLREALVAARETAASGPDADGGSHYTKSQ